MSHVRWTGIVIYMFRGNRGPGTRHCFPIMLHLIIHQESIEVRCKQSGIIPPFPSPLPPHLSPSFNQSKYKRASPITPKYTNSQKKYYLPSRFHIYDSLFTCSLARSVAVMNRYFSPYFLSYLQPSPPLNSSYTQDYPVLHSHSSVQNQDSPHYKAPGSLT